MCPSSANIQKPADRLDPEIPDLAKPKVEGFGEPGLAVFGAMVIVPMSESSPEEYCFWFLEQTQVKDGPLDTCSSSGRIQEGLTFHAGDDLLWR